MPPALHAGNFQAAACMTHAAVLSRPISRDCPFCKDVPACVRAGQDADADHSARFDDEHLHWAGHARIEGDFLGLFLQGKTLMLITNSDYVYTNTMMSHAYDRYLAPHGMRWRDIFDMVRACLICAATLAPAPAQPFGPTAPHIRTPFQTMEPPLFSSARFCSGRNVADVIPGPSKCMHAGQCCPFLACAWVALIGLLVTRICG